MWAIEFACVAILGLYAWVHRREPGWLFDVALLAVAGWLGEETCIVGYHFYQYAPAWHARVGEVPLLIAAIWPAIVMSARAVARSLLPVPHRAGRLALLTGALVVFDAALIEPIAVRAGLWSWNEPGLFTVPLIGILGWGFFAAAATFVLEYARGMRRFAVIAIAPVATHAMLLVSWWGLFRWVLRGIIAPVAGIASVLVAAVFFARAVRRRNASLSSGELFARTVATGLFMVLLVRGADVWLVAYTLAFTPPHLLLSAHALATRSASPAASKA